MTGDTGPRAWLIRHGQSESNAGLPTNGPGAAPLTELGHAEARRVAARFDAPPALIAVSPFRRARETAAPTIARFPDVPCEEWPVQEFTYLGALHGPQTTVEQRRPFAEAYWRRCDPDLVEGGDGESFRDLIGRARAMLERLAALPADGPVAVFSHAMFIRAVIWTLATGTAEPSAADMRTYERLGGTLLIPNGAVVELRPGGRSGYAVVVDGPASGRLAK
ncbi:histidine phosphatase family protein [Actinomadura parmotrematis]|uniref:Histidine phosphatase family protein n=1 Tax=Actinomadura parmotrematis TaxID=2864039 RepID=A0ABS7G0E0_9ACTN|nr:histidine phosphatase family protein [Actinomadura parmotrematis]MBW8486153.1 histidine phosphatase family protein [Actinomadura parmotrematis]